MTRTWPVPRVPGQYSKRPTFLQRIQSGMHPVHRRQLQVVRDECLSELSSLDRDLESLCARRVELLDRLDAMRDQLWPEVATCRGRRPPALDSPPLPPLVAGARMVGGRSLRGVCLTLLGRSGPLSLPDMHAQLHLYGYGVSGDHAVKTLADAMNYEVRCGRAVRVARGVYDVAAAAGGAGGSSGRGPWRSGPDPRRSCGDPEAVVSWSSVPVDPAERTDPDRWIPDPWPDPPVDPALDVDVAAPAPPAEGVEPPPATLGTDSAQIRSRECDERGSGCGEEPSAGADGRDEGVDDGSHPEDGSGGSATRRSHGVDSVEPDEGPP